MSVVPVMTSPVPAVTAQDLELEHAELLPARESRFTFQSYNVQISKFSGNQFGSGSNFAGFNKGDQYATAVGGGNNVIAA